MSVGVRVRGWVCGVALLGAAGVGAVGVAAPQQDDRALAATVGAELRGLASRAGVVFVGQVTKIEPKDRIVEITFAVEQPVLGVVGGTYVMREWAGRWTGGQQPFQVGQRAMFFLHAANAAGLSSAVDGMMGVVPVVPMGADGQALLDVRWLATRVRRSVGAPVAAALGAVALADGVAVTRGWQTEGMAEPKGVRLPEGVAGQALGVGPVRESVDAQR